MVVIKIGFFDSLFDGVTVFFVFDETVDEVINAGQEWVSLCFSVAIDNIVVDLAGAFVAAVGDLFDGFVEVGVGLVEEELKELYQFLLLHRGYYQP